MLQQIITCFLSLANSPAQGYNTLDKAKGGAAMEALARNIFDVIEEGQFKLGYREEAIRLYYPLASLNAFMDASFDSAQMREALARFAMRHRETFGEIAVSSKGDRFCLTVPPEGVEAVHTRANENGFLAEFIRAIERHGTTIDDLLAVFRRHSQHVVAQPLHNGEFDYLVYFADGVPDAYRYCIAQEPCHMTYHRFTKADYDAFGF